MTFRELLNLYRSGELSPEQTREVEEAIMKLVADAADRQIVLDLEQLSYISSAGLRVLLFARKAMDGKGSLRVTHVNETIMEIFEVTGFADILMIE